MAFNQLIAIMFMLMTMNAFVTAQNTTSSTTNVNEPVKELSYRSSTVKDCTLFAADQNVANLINNDLEAGKHLIKFYLRLPKLENVFNSSQSSPVYRPNYWVRTPGRLGSGLLLLRPEYDVLSLMTLELQVVTMHVDVEAVPADCLGSLNKQDAERAIRNLVLNNFQNSSSDEIDVGRPNDNVCNIHATNDAGNAKFRYLCCRKNQGNYIDCEYLTGDTWLNVLFGLLLFIKILVALFAPRFIPDSLYRLKYTAMSYRHTCPEEKTVVLNTLLTKTPTEKRAKIKFKLSSFETMEYFKEGLKDLEEDKPFRITLKHILISVREERLLSRDSAPVGLLQTFHRSFFKCQVSERDALADCCKADMLSVFRCKLEYSFYSFCKKLMQFVLLMLLAVPWILRVVAYYKYAHDEYSMRRIAANERGLHFDFPGNFVLWLTPLHAIFLVSYIILSLETCLFGVLGRFSTNSTTKLKFVIRKCFRDMREMDQSKVANWTVKLILLPCTKYGLLGILICTIVWPLLLPLIILAWCFYLFPTINITLRLLYTLFSYICPCVHTPKRFVNLNNTIGFTQIMFPDSSSKQTKKAEQEILRTTADRLYQLLIIIFCIISIYSIILLTVELVSFIAEIIAYTSIGIILNAGTILKYISLCLVLGLYGHEVFGFVTKSFQAFNSKMNQIVFGLADSKAANAIYTPFDSKNNVSFTVKTEQGKDLESPITLTKGIDGKPSWNVSRLLLFLDKHDEPFIPRSFYNKACNMDYFAAPGDVLFRYLLAAREFGYIILFLVFVLLVVLAFGDSFELSVTNKLLVTVLGSFVPLLLRKVVFKSHVVPDIDSSSIFFQVPLTELLDPYQETWPISDIEPELIEPLDSFEDEYDLIIDTGGQVIKTFSETVELV